MDLYMAILAWFATTLISGGAGIVVMLMLTAISTFICFMIAWGLDALVTIRINGIRISDHIKLWSIVAMIFLFIFLPLGAKVAVAVHYIMTKHDVVRVEDRQEIRSYLLVSHTSPKHVYATLKDVRTGQVYERQYVSAYCDVHTQPNEIINIRVSVWHNDNAPQDQYLTFIDLPSALCGR